jgi:type IV secretion system protein VirB6
MFLIALSGIALAVLLALGPMFITLLLFDATRRFFEAWLAQLANYALITILTVLVAALLLQVVESYAVQTAARGTAIATVDALNMVLVAVLVFLLLRQVMPIASGLAGGIALSSFGMLSRFVSWGMRRGSASAGAVAALAGGSLAATGALPAQPLRLRRTVWHQS